jgi:hypothetical protein
MRIEPSLRIALLITDMITQLDLESTLKNSLNQLFQKTALTTYLKCPSINLSHQIIQRTRGPQLFHHHRLRKLKLLFHHNHNASPIRTRPHPLHKQSDTLLSAIFARSGASRRSIVAADMPINARSVSSLILSSSNRRNVGTNSPITGASRFPVGAPSTAQQNRSAVTVSLSYFGTRARRSGTTILGFNAAASALQAWLRCQPVVAHS